MLMANDREKLMSLVNLLREKAIKQCEKSEGDDSKKGYWQAGQAEGYGWAADHLETIVKGIR